MEVGLTDEDPVVEGDRVLTPVAVGLKELSAVAVAQAEVWGEMEAEPEYEFTTVAVLEKVEDTEEDWHIVEERVLVTVTVPVPDTVLVRVGMAERVFSAVAVKAGETVPLTVTLRVKEGEGVVEGHMVGELVAEGEAVEVGVVEGMAVIE